MKTLNELILKAAVLLLFSTMVFHGCGRPADEAEGQHAIVPEVDLDAMLLSSFGDDAVEEVKPVPAAARPVAASPAPAGDILEDGVTRVIERVRILRQEGRFDDARTLARRGIEQLGTRSGIAELRQLERQITGDLQEAVRLQFAFEQLSSASLSEREAAARELVMAGEIGRILLRRAVRLGNARAAVIAATRLSELNDLAGANQIIERILASEAPRFISALLGILERTGRSFDLHYIPELYNFMDSAAGKPHEEQLWEVVRTRAMAELPVDALEDLLKQVKEDRTFQQRRIVQFFASIFIRRCSRNVETFNALFRSSDTHRYLSGYVNNARDSGLGQPAAWGRAMEHAFKEFDFSALERNLVAWYPFEEDSGRRAVNSAADAYHGDLRDISQTRISGVIGRALDFTPDEARVEIEPRDKLRTIHHRDYSFVAWVRPEGRPSGEQPDILWGVVVKEGWHIGLMIDSDGRPLMTHYLHGNEAVNARAERALPLGRWSLLVGSVDRQNGTVRIFVNGVRESEERFTAMSMASSSQDGGTVRIGLARPGAREWAYRFKGAIDEVRIYDRALGDTDAAALYALGE